MAVLLRRLARVVGVSAEGRPLGSICPCRRWTSGWPLAHPLTHALPKTDPARR